MNSLNLSTVAASLLFCGVVGFGDILVVLGTWGDCPPPPVACPADLDGDGSVGFGDLLVILANWT